MNNAALSLLVLMLAIFAGAIYFSFLENRDRQNVTETLVTQCVKNNGTPLVINGTFHLCFDNAIMVKTK